MPFRALKDSRRCWMPVWNAPWANSTVKLLH